MALKIGSKGPLGQNRHDSQPDRYRTANKKRKPPERPFGEVLEETAAQVKAKTEETPMVLATTPFGWSLCKYYGPFTLSCSENDLTVWKQTGAPGRMKADADEAARFKADIAAAADQNPVIASILASCEALRG